MWSESSSMTIQMVIVQPDALAPHATAQYGMAAGNDGACHVVTSIVSLRGHGSQKGCLCEEVVKADLWTSDVEITWTAPTTHGRRNCTQSSHCVMVPSCARVILSHGHRHSWGWLMSRLLLQRKTITALTPITLETFTEWKKKRAEERAVRLWLFSFD